MLEFVPQNRRFLVALLSIWQPLGVIFATGVAYGTAAEYRCDPALPACNAVPDGTACCTVSSNMGWRYLLIVLGGVTLIIFFLRFFVFRFHESPKFLLSKGKEAEAIEVLHKIAKFNKAPAPTLTIEHFREIDQGTSQMSGYEKAPLNTKATAGMVLRNTGRSLKHSFGGLFGNKLQALIFGLLTIAYMVRTHTISASRRNKLMFNATGRLLVLQSGWVLPTFGSTAIQRIHWCQHRQGDIQAIYLHLHARRYRRCSGTFLYPASSRRPKVVAGLLRCHAGSIDGTLHSSPNSCRLRRLKCSGVHHADCEC